jgi:hypothetical protein
MSFDPLDSSLGLLLAFEADSGVYHDAGTTACTNGQTVKQWNDKSPNANNLSFSQTTTPTQTWITNQVNGLPAVSWNGGREFVTAVQITLGYFTKYLVYKQNTQNNPCVQEHGADIGANQGDRLLLNTASTYQVRRASATTGFGAAAGWAANAWNIMACGYGGSLTKQNCWLNGALAPLTASSQSDPGTGTVTAYQYLGCQSGGWQPYSDLIAAFYVYNSYHTLAQMLGVWSYFAAKYAISCSIPRIGAR